MPSTVFTLMFIASAPILLMPTIFTFATRQRYAIATACANVLLWAGLYYTVRSIVVDTDGPNGLNVARPGVVLVLVAWLGLLRFSVRGVASKRS